MALNEIHLRTLKDWMRSKAIVQCPACGEEVELRRGCLPQSALRTGGGGPHRGRGSGEASVRQLWVRGALRRRDVGDSGYVGQREGLVIQKGTVP